MKSSHLMFILTPEYAFEVASKDLEDKLEWIEAKSACTVLKDRWRLPSKKELAEMFRLHEKGIGGFDLEYYWSSDGFNNFNASRQSFLNGNQQENSNTKNAAPKCKVRPVRTI